MDQRRGRPEPVGRGGAAPHRQRDDRAARARRDRQRLGVGVHLSRQRRDAAADGAAGPAPAGQRRSSGWARRRTGRRFVTRRRAGRGVRTRAGGSPIDAGTFFVAAVLLRRDPARRDRSDGGQQHARRAEGGLDGVPLPHLAVGRRAGLRLHQRPPRCRVDHARPGHRRRHLRPRRLGLRARCGDAGHGGVAASCCCGSASGARCTSGCGACSRGRPLLFVLAGEPHVAALVGRCSARGCGVGALRGGLGPVDAAEHPGPPAEPRLLLRRTRLGGRHPGRAAARRPARRRGRSPATVDALRCRDAGRRSRGDLGARACGGWNVPTSTTSRAPRSSDGQGARRRTTSSCSRPLVATALPPSGRACRRGR